MQEAFIRLARSAQRIPTASGRRPTSARSWSTWRGTTTGVVWCRSGTSRPASRRRAVGASPVRGERERRAVMAALRALPPPAAGRRGPAVLRRRSASRRSPPRWACPELGQDPSARGLRRPRRGLEGVHDRARRPAPPCTTPCTAAGRPRRPATPICSTESVVGIDADRRRRRPSGVVAAVWVAALAVVTVLVMALTPPTRKEPCPCLVGSLVDHDGRARRYRPVARPVHQAVRARLRGRRVPRQPVDRQELLVLTDIAYYLIFAAYILFTASLAAAVRLAVVHRHGHVGAGRVGGAADRRGPPRRRGPARRQHRRHAGTRAAVLAQPAAAAAEEPGTVPPSQRGGRSIYERAAELERAADDDPR